MNKQKPKGAGGAPKLTKKEQLFCRLYSAGESPRAAAAEAGFSPPGTASRLLLLRREINAEIKRLKASAAAPPTAAEGLRKIAFGSITDAVKLALGDGDAYSSPETLDLFCVSEIKIPKEGAMEIKFFDRIKALSALSELENGGENDASGILSAIIKSAKLQADVSGEDE